MPVVGRIVPPLQRCLHPNTYDVTIHAKVKVANRVKVANQLTLRWVNYPRLSRWT